MSSRGTVVECGCTWLNTKGLEGFISAMLSPTHSGCIGRFGRNATAAGARKNKHAARNAPLQPLWATCTELIDGHCSADFVGIGAAHKIYIFISYHEEGPSSVLSGM